MRALDLRKPPSVAETIDWARAVQALGHHDLDRRRGGADPRRRAQERHGQGVGPRSVAAARPFGGVSASDREATGRIGDRRCSSSPWSRGCGRAASRSPRANCSTRTRPGAHGPVEPVPGAQCVAGDARQGCQPRGAVPAFVRGCLPRARAEQRTADPVPAGRPASRLRTSCWIPSCGRCARARRTRSSRRSST